MPAKFFGMIANLGENLGKLDAFLKETGLRENTIVVLMTYNGGTGGVNCSRPFWWKATKITKSRFPAGRQPQKMTYGTIPGGKALPIAAAKLAIAGQERSVKTKPTAKTAVMQVSLK